MSQSAERVGTRSGVTLIMAVLVGCILGALFSATAFAQTDKVRDKIKVKEAEREKIVAEVALETPLAESEKQKIAEQFGRLFDSETRKTLGETIASAIAGCSAEVAVTPETVLARLEDKLTTTYGSEIYNAAQLAFSEMIAIILEDGGEPSPVMCSKHLREAVELSFGTEDFEQAWRSTISRFAPRSRRIVELERRLGKLDREIKTLRRMLSTDIGGVIPTGMAPVLGRKNAELGLSTSDIVKLAVANGETVEKNHFLFSGSQTEKSDVASFLLDLTEVTHQMYWYFVQQTGHRAPQFYAGLDKRKEKVFKEVWPDGKIPAGWENRPMTYVSYDDAIAYCEWTGTRLPTEEEWELAARSGENGFDGRYWPYGSQYVKYMSNDDQSHDIPERLRLRIPDEVDLPAVMPVGSFPEGASPLGHFDLVGNAAEWTSSPFLPRPSFERNVKTKVEGHKVDLTVPTDWNEDWRVIRGGHCNQRDLIASSAMRSGVPPLGAYKYVGFRRARSGVPGLDLLNNLSRNRKLDARLQTFKILKHDEKCGHPIPQIDRTTGTFAVIEKLDWCDELDVPGQASAVLIANRDLSTSECSSFNKMQSLSRGEDDVSDGLLFGMIHSDVPFASPPLAAGTWFVCFKEGYKTKDEDGKKIKVEDAFIFVPRIPNLKPVRVEAKGTEVLIEKASVNTSMTRLELPDRDLLRCIWAFEKSKKTLTVELRLETTKGALAEYE